MYPERVLRRVIATMLLLAGCESQGALELVVPGTDGIAHVRLYYGVGDDTNGPIAPENTPLVVPNRWWPLDDYAYLDVHDMTADQEVVFQVKRGDGEDTKLSIVMIVGFDDMNVPKAAAKLEHVEIPTDSIARHTVFLLPLATQTANVQTWPSGVNTCVMWNEWFDIGAQMVVDKNDPDCDGYTDNDCLPNVYNGRITSPLDQINCLLPQPVTVSNPPTTMAQACVLGGPQCVDGRGIETTCELTPYCVPQSVCDHCAFDLSCAMDVSNVPYYTRPTHIKCSTGHTSAGQLCGNDMTVQLGAYLGPGCSGDVKISNGGTFGTSVRPGSPSSSITIDVSNLQSSCNFTLKASGQLATVGDSVVSAFVAGKVGERGFAIPVVVASELSLPCGTTCDVLPMLNSPDYMSECISSPILAE